MSISLNGFSLSVFPAEKVHRFGSNYFTMADKTEYKIELSNNRSVKADAHVWIDGKKVGVWRINNHSTISIERPSDISKKFVLLKEGTVAARDSDIVSGKSENGLIKVEFQPEKESYRGYVLESDCSEGSLGFSTNNIQPMMKSCTNQMYCSAPTNTNQNLSAAGTGLGSDSGQRFRSVGQLYDIDTENITEIYARLVVDDNKTINRQFQPLRDVRYSTDVPPPINRSYNW